MGITCAWTNTKIHQKMVWWINLRNPSTGRHLIDGPLILSIDQRYVLKFFYVLLKLTIQTIVCRLLTDNQIVFIDPKYQIPDPTRLAILIVFKFFPQLFFFLIYFLSHKNHIFPFHNCQILLNSKIIPNSQNPLLPKIVLFWHWLHKTRSMLQWSLSQALH